MPRSHTITVIQKLVKVEGLNYLNCLKSYLNQLKIITFVAPNHLLSIINSVPELAMILHVEQSWAGSRATKGSCAYTHPGGSFHEPETHAVLLYLFSKLSVGFSCSFRGCVLKYFLLNEPGAVLYLVLCNIRPFIGEQEMTAMHPEYLSGEKGCFPFAISQYLPFSPVTSTFTLALTLLCLKLVAVMFLWVKPRLIPTCIAGECLCPK